MTLRRSVLHSFVATQARGVQERFGWELPVAYTDVAAEFQAATEGVAVHDASYVGRLKAEGRDVLDLLNRMSSNKVISLPSGQGAPTILTTDRGRILDLIGVVSTGDYILLITSPGNQKTVIEWLDKYTIMEDITVGDITAEAAMLSVLGPGSRVALESAAAIRLDQLQPFHSVMAQFGGQPIRIIRRHLGELPCFDLIVPADAASPVWQHLVTAGITPVGMEAYEAVRVKYGAPSFGREIGESYNPLEAGLIGSINFEKGCYIGQEVIARLDTYKKVQRHLAMLRFPPGLAVPAGTSLRQEGQEVGAVTSVARIPTTGEVVGLGYVKNSAAIVGIRLELAGIAGGWAQVEQLPQLFGPGKD